MIHLQINPQSGVPVYRQIMDQLKYYIASGTLEAGDQLPSIREAARELSINPDTVVKAYTELQHEGVIEKKQGKGAFVSEQGTSRSDEEMKKALRQPIRQVVVEARQMDVSPETVIRLLLEEFEALEDEASGE